MVLFVLILFFPFVWDRMHFFRFPRLFSFVFFLGLFMKQISKWISLLGQRRRRDNRSKQIGETNALSFLIFFSLKKKKYSVHPRKFVNSFRAAHVADLPAECDEIAHRAAELPETASSICCSGANKLDSIVFVGFIEIFWRSHLSGCRVEVVLPSPVEIKKFLKETNNGYQKCQ